MPQKINGVDCLTQHQFTAGKLIGRGKRIRKLKAIRIPRGRSVAVSSLF